MERVLNLALEASLASAGSVYIDAAAVKIIPSARLLPQVSAVVAVSLLSAA